MKIEEFVEEYKKADNKYSFLDKHIKREYVPYLDKVSTCKSIVETANHITDKKERKIYKADTPTQELLLIMNMVKLYTDIEFESADFVHVYDELSKYCILEHLFHYNSSFIDEGANEFLLGEEDRFRNIFSMVLNDFYENENSVSAVLLGIKEGLSFITDSIMNMAESEVNNMEDSNGKS